jgi:maltose-binding protein MalE
MIRTLLDKLQLAWYAVLYGSAAARITAAATAFTLVVGGAYLLPSLVIDENKRAADASTLIVWYEGVTTNVNSFSENPELILPGYTLKLVDKSETTIEQALKTVDEKDAPDIVLGSSALLNDGYASGTFIAPENVKLTDGKFSNAALKLASVDGKLVAVPYALETSVFIWNTAIYGKAAPSTLGEMIDWHNSERRSTPSLCVDNGSWGAQPLLDVLSGAPRTAAGTAEMFGTGFEKSFAGLLATPTPFLSFDCAGFDAGGVPFALVGQWQIAAIEEAEFGAGPFPGTAVGSTGTPWVTSVNAYMTKYVKERGNADAAQKLLGWTTNSVAQAGLTANGARIVAHIDAAKEWKNKYASPLLNVVSDAEPQPATLLRNAGKGNWFDLVSAFLTDAVDKPASLSALRATLVKQLAANEAVTKDAPATKK